MKELLAKINSYKQFVIDVQTQMTACPAVSPHVGGAGENAKADYLVELFKTLKFDEVYVVNAKDKKAKNGVRPNVVAKYYGEDKSKTFWVMAHMDVVPPGDAKLWKTDPFKAVVKGDKIYGRGTEDNQQGIVSGLVAVKAMMDLGVRPPCTYALLLNADEEIGSTYGIVDLLKNHAKMFGKNDVFLVPDGGVPSGEQIEVAEKNMLWLKFTTVGKQAHASMPGSGNNAFRAGSALVVQLNDLYKKFNKKDKLFAPAISTFEPTKKEANVPNVNTIPGMDVFYLDCRILPSYKNEQIIAEAKKIAAGVAKQYKVQIKVDVEMSEFSKPTSKDAKIVKLISKYVKEVYKNNPKVVGIGGGTVAAYLRNKGYDAVVYSKLDESLHAPNEYCSIKNTLGDGKVFALAALNYK